ncbi:hypothetical protein TrRE_jg13137, partial [Triparma retinervis]
MDASSASALITKAAPDIDPDIAEYLGAMLESMELSDLTRSNLSSTIVPFLESSDLPPSLHSGVVMGEEKVTAAEAEANAYLWGTDTFAAKFNEQRDAEVAESAKDRRKAKQELERVRKEYEAKVRLMEEEERSNNGKVAAMVLPDYTSGRNERDIQVQNVSLDLDNGKRLLDDAEIKFTYRRRYGLVGKNGIGKTTLLKAIASFDVEGMPRHH